MHIEEVSTDELEQTIIQSEVGKVVCWNGHEVGELVPRNLSCCSHVLLFNKR